MRTVHRLVLVLAFFGTLLMLGAIIVFTSGKGAGENTIPLLAVPGILAATIIYPIVWVFRGAR